MTKTYGQPEQDLIDNFIVALGGNSNSDIIIKTLINKNCRSKTYADIEYISDSSIHWVIEVKSDAKDNIQNEVHKIFGDLLKETGRYNRDNCKYAILIKDSVENYYREKFNDISPEKYIGFGELIPIDTVFILNDNGITIKTWIEFYGETAYLLSNPENKARLLAAVVNVENNQLIDVDINKL